MKPFRLSESNLNAFLARISAGRTIFTHEAVGDQFRLVKTDHWDPSRHTLGTFRPVQPLKSLVFRPRELLGALFGEPGLPALELRIVLGVKNCDLSALQIHDFVLRKNTPPDPYYAQLREQTILVSCDCTDCREVCFCPAVGEQPYPKAGYDINLSPQTSGFIVDAGSERGEALLQTAQEFLQPATEPDLQVRQQNRDAIYRRVADQAASVGLTPGLDLQGAVVKSEGQPLWKAFAEDCVECGACNFVCCTCHCFLLRDGQTGGRMPERVKQWDSCLHKNFARVAGGANPRQRRTERLYNRFDKKFNFFPQVLGHYACDGCGRCTEACTGQIDIRRVLKEAVG